MKKLILFFLLLLAAVSLGLFIHNYPIYVFITAGHTYIQSTLWFIVAAIVLFIFLVLQLFRFLHAIYSTPAKFRRFHTKRRSKKLRLLTKKGLNAFLVQDWTKAELYFNQSASKEIDLFFHYIAAANAAFMLQKQEAVELYFKKARAVAEPKELLALEMMQVRFQLASGLYIKALETLKTLQKTLPRHPFILNSLKTVYLAFQNWQSLMVILPLLARYGDLNIQVYSELEKKVMGHLLQEAGKHNSLIELEKIWQLISPRYRKDPIFIAEYARHLIAQNQHQKAEKMLSMALKKSRLAILLDQYAVVNSLNSAKQLLRAESWLPKDTLNPDLLLCLGQLCIKYRLWGKARMYLEKSLKLKRCTRVYLALGHVYEHLDQKQAALECYKLGATENQ